MTTIPEDIVEKTWREVGSFDSRDAWKAMEKPELELTDEETGLLFLVLRTVVELLDGACKRIRR
jgi:hypothetical protein